MYYSHSAIEKKWQEFWDKQKTFLTRDTGRPKKYILDMFPYPSGKGLHVGHPRGYTASDILARMYRMQGFDVLHPIGWDAFGLPAEQYAMQTGQDPQKFTLVNIDHFRKQLKSMGFSYDYNREVNTSMPAYYRTTQWIFGLLYKSGLAELQNINVNWCPKLGTVLANEELVKKGNQLFSERGGYPVYKKPMKQWVLKIREYADELLAGLDNLQWNESIKQLQKNWIGKEKGYYCDVPVYGLPNHKPLNIRFFVHSLHELMAAQYVAASMESPLTLALLQNTAYAKTVQKFLGDYQNLSDVDRVDVRSRKDGLPTNLYIKNPLSGAKCNIWIANYLSSDAYHHYAAGVPNVRKMDFLFAKHKNIFVPQQSFKILQQTFLAQLKTSAVKISDSLKANGTIKPGFSLKLHNWVFSRQRYWGEPIPIVHLSDEQTMLVPEEELPITLPAFTDVANAQNDSYQPPLASVISWVNIKTKHGSGKRDANTMPQWAGSCWYYIAYLLKTNEGYLQLESPKAQALLKRWLPVDIYIGGQEHAVLHLLYARFWHKVLFKNNLVNSSEPFIRLINQGMILGPDHQKMSKSKGNTISVDGVINTHGADALRLCEMFMGPIESEMSWSIDILDACRHWLDRVYRLWHFDKITEKPNKELEKPYHAMVQGVTDEMQHFRFNTAISKLMVFINHCYKTNGKVPKEYFLGFVKILSCFAPHLGNELASLMGKTEDLAYANWPIYDPAVLIAKNINIPVQINGKLKIILTVPKGLSVADLKKEVLKYPDVFMGKPSNVKKWIIIPDKIVNLVI